MKVPGTAASAWGRVAETKARSCSRGITVTEAGAASTGRSFFAAALTGGGSGMGAGAAKETGAAWAWQDAAGRH